MKKQELLKLLESLSDDDDCSKILEQNPPEPPSPPTPPKPPTTPTPPEPPTPPKADDKVTYAELLRLIEAMNKKDDKKKVEEESDAQIFI